MTDPRLLAVIAQVRRRWRSILLLRGAAILTATIFVLIALSAIGFSRFGFDPSTVFRVRVTVIAAAAIAFAWLIVRPMLRRANDEQVALFIEENEPGLQALLISAVEASNANSVFTAALVDQAARKVAKLNMETQRKRLYQNAAAFASVVIVATAFIAAGPPSLRRAGSALLRTPIAEAAKVLSIGVTPGNRTIARGSNVTLSARLRGFDANEAYVSTKGADGEWTRLPMLSGEDIGTFDATLLSVSDTTQYFIEAENVRSPVFTIAVIDAPYVKGLTLEYTYPAYTGLAPRRVENGGDIVAPKGTIVRIIANTSAPVAQARLAIEGAAPIAMTTSPNGVSASVRIQKNGFYHVELPDIEGHLTSASAQFSVTALEDRPPSITVEKPGRDVKVTAVDEVFVSAHSEDDYGVSNLELVYSMNGGEQRTQALVKPSDRQPSVTGAYTFMLEDYKLQPGDVVSYFVRATDNYAFEKPHVATSDMFFIQIRPFSRNYKAAEQQQGQGQGQQNEDPGALSERQRQIISATFNIQRDSATYNVEGYAQAITTVEVAQKRLREDIGTLVNRMRQRGVVGMDSLFAQIAQLLPQAQKEMSDAEAQLQKKATRDAIAPEQRALQQLTRAEALYRDVQVQMQQNQQQQGGGGQSMPDDLANLFELERDQLKNQYESLPQSQQEQQQQQTDEALQKLRELARRQQQSEQSAAQRRLANEVEEQARQLERLARENRSQAMNEAAQSMRSAANSMRQGQSGRAGQQLDEARRRLQENSRESLQSRIAEARRATEQMQGDSSQRGRRMGEMEQRLDRMSAETRGTNPSAAREVGKAADIIRDSKLRERIRAAEQGQASRTPEFNRAQEEQIQRDIGRVAQQLGNAEQVAGNGSREARAQQNADNARRIAQGIEAMRGQQQGQRGAQGQMRGQANGRAQQLRELREQMQGAGFPTNRIDEAIASMGNAAGAMGRRSSAEVEKMLRDAARAVEDAEFDLRRMAQTESAQRLFTNGRAQVPSRYRKAVEEYYRSLSRPNLH